MLKDSRHTIEVLAERKQPGEFTSAITLKIPGPVSVWRKITDISFKADADGPIRAFDVGRTAVLITEIPIRASRILRSSQL